MIGKTQGKVFYNQKIIYASGAENQMCIRDRFKAEPREIKGYYVDKSSISKGVHSPEYYGYGYFRYTLVKLETRGG